ncbi:hypothetical protein AVEN_148679-1 [Araneus ventricosus]|uniref:Uncharacterized protein n=1 Tax=Araneus ventricosus TaxID=182803 RepID=A0A4Y2G7K2_ARAVE|nr:hypothetical protein AVEN_148679-1 [Araneus ventricosus]
MSNLETSLSDQEFEIFGREGYFTVRRSDKFWCGVWTDMTIQHVLMRFMKVRSGLTQDRNMSDGVVARWICTMPGSFQVTEAVETFAEVTGEYSDQHISLSKSWQTRDTSDLKKFLIWLKQHSSFNQAEELMSLSSGIVADDKINCDSAEKLGENAVKGIVGKRFAEVALKRKVQVLTLAAMGNTIIIDQDPVVVNPN